MTLRAYQPAFVGGELSPALWARVDTKNYAVGLKTALKAKAKFKKQHLGFKYYWCNYSRN